MTCSRRVSRMLIGLAALMLVAGCGRGESNSVPPVVTDAIVVQAAQSSVAVPISASVADLERLLNARVPASFTTTEAQAAACAASGIAQRIGCQFTGTVNRGDIKVAGVDANVLRLTIPVAGTVDARQLARFVGSQPVSAAADIEALVRLDVVDDWQPVARVTISYRWTNAPGVALFGRRISLAGAADPLVARLITQIEAMVPEALAKLQPRERLAAAWQQGFAVVPINPATPQVWVRTTPQKLHFANYSIENGTVTLATGATGTTETFVGTRPGNPVVTPLRPPAPLPDAGVGAFRLQVPVVADYPGLETIVETALHRIEAPPMQLRGIGLVTPEFGKVSIHATTGGRIAIGLALTASTPRQWLKPRGTVWLTAKLFNVPGSQQLDVRDVVITGSPDSASFRVLLAVARSRLVRDQIGRALSQDFAAEYDRALAAARTELANRRMGDFVLATRIDTITNGSVVVTGQGIYLPVSAAGSAALRWQPVK